MFCFLSPQTKNGDSLPSSVTPRVQRNPQASSKHPGPESEAAEQKALLTVQYSLLKILSKSLAALRHFTPDVCQILLDQVEREERCCSLRGVFLVFQVLFWGCLAGHSLSCLRQ